ncbi:MAG TPA: DUF4376 domain-containing protein, partial [Ramlibacter sp.]|nr:DUF4376 domain-containing protein [Ramlibacter sp.]
SVGDEPGALRANWTGSAWVDMPHTVPAPHDPHAGRRAELWERIKAERDSRKANGTKVGAKWFHSDADSRIQQLALFVMGASVPAVQWKTMDGSFTTMTQALAGGIFAATAASDQILFGHAETLRAVVNAAEDPGSVDIMAGWPLTFGEGE